MSERHFLLAPVGSAGDVHPYLGLGKRLRERGHRVTLYSAEPFRAAAETNGIEFASYWSVEQYEEITQHPDLWHPQRGIQLVFRTVAENMRRSWEILDGLYEPGMVVVGHTLGIGARLLEEKYDCAAATVQLAPIGIRTLHEVPPAAPGRDIAHWPMWAKASVFWLIDQLMIDRHLLPELNSLRADLGLPKVSRPLKSWSNSPQRIIGLFPEWFGGVQPDWPPQVRLTGFPLYDEAELHPPNADLEAFLAAGEPPVAVAPGSANRQAPEFFAAAVEATGKLGLRAVLLTKYDEQIPEPLPDHAMHVSYAPFSAVFPRCAAVSHHGGIGSLAQGLQAGVPQLIRPMGFDQPDNANRLHKLGVGDWLVPAQYTPDNVAAKLEALIGSAEVRAACAERRDAVADMDGIGAACDLLEELAANRRGAA